MTARELWAVVSGDRLLWVVVAVLAIIIALLTILVCGTDSTAGEPPPLGCEVRVQILTSGALAAINQLGPSHEASYALARSLNDAVGPCGWSGEPPQYRCGK